MSENKKKHIQLKDLDVYRLARELSGIAWRIYQNLDWQDKKIMGDQFIQATDSFGANIAEGYSRYHYLDKIKFFYTARASLVESTEHWLEILKERNKVNNESYLDYIKYSQKASLKLQNFISAIYRAKQNDKYQ